MITGKLNKLEQGKKEPPPFPRVYPQRQEMLKKSSLNSLQELLDGLVDLTNKPVLQVFKSLIFDYSNDDKKISRYDKKDGNKANDVQDYCFCVTMILGVVG